MKKIIKLFGTMTILREKTGIAQRTALKYIKGDIPIGSFKLGNIVKIAKELEITEQEVINILLERS